MAAVGQVAAPLRQDTWQVSVNLEGRDLGIFDTTDGGEKDSDENKYNPGGMVGEISLGGRPTIGELTTSRYYDVKRDHPLFSFINALVGSGRGTIGFTPMDFQGNVSGPPFKYSATLKTFTPPTSDSTSQDAAMMELHWTCDALLDPA
jgi:hypothetical protein